VIYHLVKTQKMFDDTVFAEQEKNHQKRFEKGFFGRPKRLVFNLFQLDL